MTTYSKLTDFAAKDALLTGNPAKIVKGTEIGAEFDSIALADASNAKGPATTVTDNALVRWDTTTGRLVQGSTVTLSDTGDLGNLPSINSGYLYGNRVINGAQEIDQVNSGAAVTPAVSLAYLTDMFGSALTQPSKLTFQQVADAPAGLKNSLKISVASQFSPAATDGFTLVTAIEGKDVIDFQLGTSGAATITLSNWIKGSVAGTYAVSILNSAQNRSYVGTVTVTTSWTQVKITLQGDTTGTWLNDNGVGMYVRWDLGSGSNFNTTAGSWQAGQFFRTSGSVTFVNQVAGSTLNITGVDCRLGSVAPTVFERRANELQLAQRYFQYFAAALAGYTNTGTSNNYYFPPLVTMRATPTVTNTGSTNTNCTGSAVSALNPSLFSFSCAGAGLGGYISAANGYASARLF